MFQSSIPSKFFRLGLLSVFCAGLFLSSGELNMSNSGELQIGNGGVYSAGAETPAAPTKKDPIDDTVNSIISILNLGIGILTFLITPLIMLAGWLLSPDWTFGEIFGLRPILHQLWVLVSNVVYVIFGFMLVFIAFANIFGGEHSKAYEMKTMLPKLVTGMLIVPFTWFIVSAVLTISNVLTASVIQLPVATILKSGGETSKLLTDKIIPKNIIFNKDIDLGENAGAKKGESVVVGGNGNGSLSMNGNFAASNCPGDGNADCLSIKEFLTGGGGGAYNLLSVYAYGIFRIQEYKAITTEQKINKILDIASKLGFGVIFFLIFGILVIAIVYALFSRAIMLWLFAMFSPIFALNYVMDFKGGLKDSVGKLSISKFISLAMVPVYVSAALAFGLMFLGLVMGASGGQADGTLKSDVVDIKTENTTTTFKFGGGDGITLTTIGLLDPEAKNGASKALDIGKGIIGTIIMNVLALAILWMAVMAALGADDITKAAVAPIKGFGDEIGKLAMKAPQYIPIPLGKGENGEKRSISMAGLGGITSQVDNALRTGASEQGAAIGKSFAEGLGLKVSELGDTLRKTTLSIKGHTNNKELQKEDWRKALAGIGDAATLNSQKEIITPQFKEMLQSTTIPKEKKDALDKLLTEGKLPEFIKQFEHYLDDSNSGFPSGGFSDVSSDQIDAYLKSIKNGSATIIPITPVQAAAANTALTAAITIAPTTITATGATTITTRGSGTARTISQDEFTKLLAELKALPTTGDLTAEQLKTKLISSHITVT